MPTVIKTTMLLAAFGFITLGEVSSAPGDFFNVIKEGGGIGIAILVLYGVYVLANKLIAKIGEEMKALIDVINAKDTQLESRNTQLREIAEASITASDKLANVLSQKPCLMKDTEKPSV